MGNITTKPDGSETTYGLRHLTNLVDDCKANANRQGERFNLFSILGVQRDEARTHSRFLSELLNPEGRHGEGPQFLRAFVTDVLALSHDISGRINVTRELSTTDQRRVDLVVEAPELIIGIEVKIDANDQESQLHDYYREIVERSRGQKTTALCYLTLNGKPPSSDSLKTLDPNKVRCLSFAGHIRDWIDTCISLSNHKPELSHALIQYKRLIEDLTGAGTSMTSLLANELTSNRNDLETALAVEKALPKAKAAIMLRFWEELSSALTHAFGKTPIVYGGKNLQSISSNYFTASRGGKHSGIKLEVAELKGEKLCLYVNIYHWIHYGLRVEGPAGTPVARPETKAQLRERLNDGNAVADKESDWLVCYYHNPSPSQEPLFLDFHSFDGPVLDLLDDDRQLAIIKNLVEHQVSLVREAKLLMEVE